MKKLLFRGIMMLGLAGGLSSTMYAAEEVKAEKEWTFLVFVNADNNLDQFGVEDMNEAAKIGSSDDVNIVFQLDREHGPAERYYVEKGNPVELEAMGEVDMGDWKVFTEFVRWGAEKYPAKHYAVVMWNHGSGWRDKNHGPVGRGISYDDSSGNHITTNQLTDAMDAINGYIGKKLDILAFDACLMQMVEVAYAVKGQVDVMIASQETEPGKGWPYDDVLRPVVKNPRMGVEKVASAIVTGYDNSYNNGSQGYSGTTQGWVKVDKVTKVMEALDEFTVAATNVLTVEQIKAARDKVQRYADAANIDLVHLMELLSASTQDADVKAACAGVVEAVNDYVGLSLYHGESGSWWTGMYPLKNSNGAAIYFPKMGAGYLSHYDDIAWAKDGLWDEWLQQYWEDAKTRPEDL